MLSSKATEARTNGIPLIKDGMQFKELIEQIADGILLFDDKGNIQYKNPAAERLWGENLEEIKRKQGQEFLKLKEKNAEIEVRRSGEKKLIVETRSVRIRKDNRTMFLVTLRDATQTVALREKLKHFSYFDELTDLYNRRGFFDMLERQIRLSNRNGTKFFLLFADIDGLKEINDTWGHITGDKALQDFAYVLTTCFRESDVIARIGGDEFSVFPIDADHRICDLLLERINNSILRFNNEQKRAYPLAVSIGKAFYDPTNPCSTDVLLRRADEEMYRIKKTKKNNN